MNAVTITEKKHTVKIDGKRNVSIEKPVVKIVTKGIAGPAGESFVNYIPIKEAEYTITADELVAGINIIGVNYAGNVTINLPSVILENRLLVVKDESNQAELYNITIVPNNI